MDPSKAASVRLAERRYRIEALIEVDTVEEVSRSEFDEEVLSWLPVLWHLGVEGATNTGEVLATLQLCDAIGYADYGQGVSSSRF